jgi:RsiW-degrading membrane proteinase PrsW (M82 family)
MLVLLFDTVIITLVLLFYCHRCNDNHPITVLGIAPMIGALVIAPMMNYYC